MFTVNMLTKQNLSSLRAPKQNYPFQNRVTTSYKKNTEQDVMNN